jgi:hypothetical protein
MDTILGLVVPGVALLAAYAFFKNQFGGRKYSKPPIPSLGDDRGVVRWFLQHDDHLNGLRSNFSGQLRNVEEEILSPCGRRTAVGLERPLKRRERHEHFSLKALDLYRRGAPFSEEEVGSFPDEMASARCEFLIFSEDALRHRP